VKGDNQFLRVREKKLKIRGPRKVKGGGRELVSGGIKTVATGKTHTRCQGEKKGS